MKTARLKCPICNSTNLKITEIPEINLNCIFSLYFECSNCGHKGKISVRNTPKGKIEILYT